MIFLLACTWGLKHDKINKPRNDFIQCLTFLWN